MSPKQIFCCHPLHAPPPQIALKLFFIVLTSFLLLCFFFSIYNLQSFSQCKQQKRTIFPPTINKMDVYVNLKNYFYVLLLGFHYLQPSTRSATRVDRSRISSHVCKNTQNTFRSLLSSSGCALIFSGLLSTPQQIK